MTAPFGVRSSREQLTNPLRRQGHVQDKSIVHHAGCRPGNSNIQFTVDADNNISASIPTPLGVTGQTGAEGPVGVSGRDGFAGAVGPTGPADAVGDPGPASASRRRRSTQGWVTFGY